MQQLIITSSNGITFVEVHDNTTIARFDYVTNIDFNCSVEEDDEGHRRPKAILNLSMVVKDGFVKVVPIQDN